MLTKTDIFLMKSNPVTKKDINEFKIEFKETLENCKNEIIAEIRKVRKIVSKWK